MECDMSTVASLDQEALTLADSCDEEFIKLMNNCGKDDYIDYKNFCETGKDDQANNQESLVICFDTIECSVRGISLDSPA